MVYGVVEFSLCAPIALLSSPAIIPAWYWKWTAVLLASYAVLGILSSGVLAGLLDWTLGDRVPELGSERGVEALATLTLIIASAAHYVYTAKSLPIALSLLLAILMSAGLFLSVLSSKCYGRFRRIHSPWVVSGILVALPWTQLLIKDRSAQGKQIFLVGLFFVLAAIVLGFRSRINARPIQSLRSRWMTLATVGVLAVFGAVLLDSRLDWAPIVRQPSAAGSIQPPNVVLLVLDTVRADHLSAYGYSRNTTPTLSDFAREATLYRRALATSAMTLPAHASLFTSLYPRWHGAHYDPPEQEAGRPLADKFDTLAEILSRHGYMTAAVVANAAYLTPYFGLHQGFHVFDTRTPLPATADAGPVLLRHGIREIYARLFGTSTFDTGLRRADGITSTALSMVDRIAATGQPFFLFANYMDAHTPYAPPHPFNSQFPGRIHGFRNSDYVALQNAVLTGSRVVDQTIKQHLISQYDGGIAFIDAEIRRLIDHLKARNLYQNTVIVVTADHGEGFGDRFLLEHAVGSVHQDQIHVPLLIKYHDKRAPAVVEDVVSQIDILPTILEAAGLPVPSSAQGRSLYSGSASRPRTLFSEEFRSPRAWKGGVEHAGIVGFLKLIANDSGRRELYDLAADPDERHNLCAKNPRRAKEIEFTLTKWLSSAPLQPSTKSAIDKEGLDRLKSLGYVQ